MMMAGDWGTKAAATQHRSKAAPQQVTAYKVPYLIRYSKVQYGLVLCLRSGGVDWMRGQWGVHTSTYQHSTRVRGGMTASFTNKPGGGWGTPRRIWHERKGLRDSEDR